VRRASLGLLVVLLLPAPAFAAAKPAVPHFKHVIVVVFENKERGAIAGNPAAPTFTALGRRYATLAGYTGVAHPSLPNYLALVSGSTQGITDDCTDCVVDGPSLADTLAAAHRTWKTYAEGLPSAGSTVASAGRYAKKHDPFVYFRSVLDTPSWLDGVVPFGRLAADVRARSLPDYSLVVPDLCNDMHDCSVATGDHWLATKIVPLLSSPALAGSVVFVVFDEGTSSKGGGGSIAAFAAGPAVRSGATFTPAVNHYSLLRTVEQAWGLPLLGQSAQARPITGIWR
jgi:hypothetical protein